MKRIHTLLILIIVFGIFSCDSAKFGNKPKLKNDVDSLSYYLGIFTGFTLKEAGCEAFDKQLFDAAVGEVLNKKELNTDQFSKAKIIIDNYMNRYREKQYEQYRNEGSKFLAENKLRNQIKVMPSGMQYEMLREGTGIKPRVKDSIVILYNGSTIDGQIFIDKYQKPDTILFSGGIAGLREALEKMSVGSKYRVYLPGELAYGREPIPGGILKPDMAVIFTIELLAVFPKK